jgi:hypothetical protein
MSLPSTSTISNTSTITGISLNDILKSTDYFSHLEDTNNKVFNTIDYNLLKINLLSWVGKGYPDAYPVFTFPVVGININGVYKCSDSTERAIADYVPFFLKRSLTDLIAMHQAKIGGILLTHSIDTNSVILLVSKPAPVENA